MTGCAGVGFTRPPRNDAGVVLDQPEGGWATCPVTESGFVRVSANPKVMPHPIGVEAAIEVLAALEGQSF